MSFHRYSGCIITVIDTSHSSTVLDGHRQRRAKEGEVCLSPSSAISAIYVFFFGLGLGPNSNIDETRGAGLNGKRGVLNSQARYLPIT